MSDDHDHDPNAAYWSVVDKIGGTVAIALVVGLFVYLSLNGFGVRGDASKLESLTYEAPRQDH